MTYQPGDRVRALRDFGESGDEDHVPADSLGTVVRIRGRRLWPVYVAFDVDPTPDPWPATYDDIAPSGEAVGEA